MLKLSKKNFFSLFIIFLIVLVPNISKGDGQVIKLDSCEPSIDFDTTTQITPGESKEICLKFTSQSDKQENVEYGFTEAILRKNGLQVCKIGQGVDGGNQFSNIFTNNQGNNRTFTLQPLESKEFKEKINIPLGMEGSIHGCIVHKATTETNESSNEMFNIEVLVQRFFNLFVGGAADLNNSIKLLKVDGDIQSFNNKIGAKSEGDNRISVNFSVQNDGNVNQSVSIKGIISNALGFEREFEIPTINISVGNKMEIKSTSLLLPSYKGFFNISSTITSEPKFDFDASNIDESAKKPITIEESTKIFIFSNVRIIVGIVLLIIIIMILRPLFKKHKTD